MKFTSFYDDRINQTTNWWPSDAEHTYSPVNCGKPNYTKEDITYKFNSSGFRCDEFSTPSDLPILFMGCSLTEGIGLPLDHCWPHFMLEYYKAMPENYNKKIPFFSLAVGGAGSDTAARELLTYIDQIKPKYIFYFLSYLSRREYCISSQRIRLWFPAWSDKKDKPYVHTVNSIFPDNHCILFNTQRNLNIINFAANKCNSQVILVEYTERNPVIISQEFADTLTNVKLIRFVESTPLVEPLPAELVQWPEKARDNSHPGVRWQWNVFNTVRYGIEHPHVQAQKNIEIERLHRTWFPT